MKIIYLLLATVLLISCTGADLEKNEGVNAKTIVGTWEYYERPLGSVNGQVSWGPLPGETMFRFTLNADGTFQKSGPYTDCDTGTYTLVDDNTIVTAYDCPNGTPVFPGATILPSYDYTIESLNNNEMVLIDNSFIIDTFTFEKYRKIQ